MLKSCLFSIDKRLKSFLRLATNITDGNREVGTLTIGHLNQESVIWMITKAVQIFSSNAIHIAPIYTQQL